MPPENSAPWQRATASLPLCLGLLGTLAIWEFYVGVSGISHLVLPAPSDIAHRLFESRAMLLENTKPTLIATFAGFGLSMSVAFAASVALDFAPRLRRAMMPVFIVSQTLPLVAIAPLFVLWFGFDLTPKVLLVALVTFFAMLVAWIDGYNATDPDLSALLRSMGASRWQVFRIARLPSALPYFFSGLRISITYAVVAAIFAEYTGARAGLGIVILKAKNSFRPDLMLAAVVVSSALTILLFGCVALIQRLSLRWRDTGRTQ